MLQVSSQPFGISVSSRDTLYHMRSASEARKALATGVFRLNTLHAVEARLHQKVGMSTVKFFMSLTRNKHNDFFKGATKDGKITSVVYELDGNKMRTKYRIAPIAYYDLHASPEKNEMEERLLSSTETIPVRPYLKRLALILGADVAEYSTLAGELANWGVPVMVFSSLSAYLANRQLPLAASAPEKIVTDTAAYIGNRRDHAVSELDTVLDFNSDKRPSDMLRLAYLLVAEAQNGNMSMSVEMSKAATRLRVKSKLALAMAVVAYWNKREKEAHEESHAARLNVLRAILADFQNTDKLARLAHLTYSEIQELGSDAEVLSDFPYHGTFAERMDWLRDKQESINKQSADADTVDAKLDNWVSELTRLKHALGAGGREKLYALLDANGLELDGYSSAYADTLLPEINNIFDDSVADAFYVRRIIRSYMNKMV